MREALGKPALSVVEGAQRQIKPDYSLLQETLSQIEEKAAAVLRNAVGSERELVAKLAEVSQWHGWKVSHASEPRMALDYISALATSSSAQLVVRSDQPVFRELPVDSALAAIGVEVAVMAQSSGHSREELRERADRADIGITGVDYAIAETGSVVVVPRQGLSRLVSLLPPVHVAIVRPSQVLECLEDILILRRLAYYQGDGDMGSYMNFITGPSRTADIEQTLVIGVHGPREAHLVLLE